MMGEVAQLRTPQERVEYLKSLIKPAPKRELRTMQEAITLLDEWEAAYHQLRRDAQKEMDALRDQLLYAQVDLTVEQGERLIERIGMQEEIARLVSLIE